MWLFVYQEFLLLPLTPTQDSPCIYSSFRRLTWSLGVTPGLDHMREMQGDRVRVSWDCIAQGVLAWHGWIPNSVKRRPSIREGRMVSATQVDTHRGRERETRAPRFTQSRVYLFLIKMPKKGAKVLPPGLWVLIFEDASLLWQCAWDPGLFCKWVCLRWPRALFLSWFHQQSRSSSHTVQ